MVSRARTGRLAHRRRTLQDGVLDRVARIQGDDKWRLYDGTSTIHAAITDAGFLSRVHNSQISFSKGDVLVCNVRMQQWQTSDGAKPNTK